ncbi:MAG TPA: hypothetical protein DCY27_05255 [Desulfobacterales bacterium]|nr:hypothetical protein [Desulfobacterales bacterium]
METEAWRLFPIMFLLLTAHCFHINFFLSTMLNRSGGDVPPYHIIDNLLIGRAAPAIFKITVFKKDFFTLLAAWRKLSDNISLIY